MTVNWNKNKKSNMYGWIDGTWNPIKGKCPHDCSYCLDGDTLILMSNLSYKKLHDIKIGDKIIGTKKEEGYRHLQESVVINKHKKVDIAYKIITEHTSVICSSNHRWLIDRLKWRNIVNGLKVGSKIKLLTPTVYKNNFIDSDSYKKGYLRGMIFGDGTLKEYTSKEQKIIRNNKEYTYSKKQIYKFRLSLKDLEALERTKKYLDYFGLKTFNHIHGGLQSIRKDGKQSFNKIKEIIQPINMKSGDFFAGYISGMFDAEGSFSEGALRICNKFIDELKLSLNYFGFKYHTYIQSNGVKTITLQGGLDEHIRFFNITNPSIQRKRLRFLKAIKRGYSKILSIEYAGEKELYDIQTSTEDFIANGLISHNCYMKVFPQGELRFDEKCMNNDLGSGNFIFVGSSTDMFVGCIDADWIARVLDYCKKFDNTYLFQSKNPERFRDFEGEFPKNVILGTTIETNRENSFSNAPDPAIRKHWLSQLDSDKMVSIEPIMDFDIDVMVRWIKEIKPQFVSIGADSKGHNLPEPSAEKINTFIKELRKFTEVRIKDNLKRLRK